MRHLATYMLLVLGGNASPTKEDVTTALSAVGVDVSLPQRPLVDAPSVMLLFFGPIHFLFRSPTDYSVVAPSWRNSDGGVVVALSVPTLQAAYRRALRSTQLSQLAAQVTCKRRSHTCVWTSEMQHNVARADDTSCPNIQHKPRLAAYTKRPLHVGGVGNCYCLCTTNERQSFACQHVSVLAFTPAGHL